MPIFTRTRLALTCTLGVVGCGIVSGLDNLSVGSGDATVEAGADGEPAEVIVADASIDVGPGCEAGACSAPAGFQPIFLALDQNTDCAGAEDVVVDPGPAPLNACECSCSVSTSCVPVNLQYVSGLTCTNAAMSLGSLDGGCNVGSGMTAPSRLELSPFSPDASCTNKLLQSGTIPSTPGRLCPLAQCSECKAPPGYALCYIGNGKQVCPIGTSHVVTTAATVQCSACSACKPGATCAGTVKFSDDGVCGNTISQTIALNGTCDTVNVDVFGSLRYTPDLDASCASGTSAASVQLADESTVCCP